jgi:hypothetical protein
MDARASAIDRRFQSESILCGRTKIPPEFIWVSTDFLQIPELVLFSVMPEHGFAKDESEWHFVNQRFECAGTCVGTGKIGMGPGPEIAMPVSTVVPLHSESQRASRKIALIECDVARKKSVGMRGSRESNPALVAQGDAKQGTVL